MIDDIFQLKSTMRLFEDRRLYASVEVDSHGDVTLGAGVATLSEIHRMESELFPGAGGRFYSYTPEQDVFSLMRESLSRAIEFYEKELNKQRESFSSLPLPHRSFSVNDWGLLGQFAVRSTMKESIETLKCLVLNLRYKYHEINEMEHGDTSTLTWTCQHFLQSLNESGLLSLYRTTPEGATL